MPKKSLIFLISALCLLLPSVVCAQKDTIASATIAYERPDFAKRVQEFLDKFKKRKIKSGKKKLKEEIADLKKKQATMEEMIEAMAPELNKPPFKGFKLTEFSLHAIEESKYLSVYDSKNYYRTERQWGEYIGRSDERLRPVIRRSPGGRTVYGFHPFWMGLHYYNYDFQLYDRVAYFGYSVDPATGNASTRFSAHSFASSRIIQRAADSSGGKCKVDLCVTSYNLKKNQLFFSAGWENRLRTLTDSVTSIVAKAGGGGVCIDFQQVPTEDSSKFVSMVKMFYDKFNAISPKNYQISIVLPSFSQYFPYTMSANNFRELWRYANRFIIMGYSSYAALYNPEKDSLTSGISRDVLWNILLVDDGINHYSALTQDTSSGPMSPERIIRDKFILSLPACEIKMPARDSVQALKYSDLKLFKLDEGVLGAFQEKLTYATLKDLNGVALWSMGYDNGIGMHEIQQLIAAYTFGAKSKDKDLVSAMQKLIAENRALSVDISEFFPLMDSLTESIIPLPDVLRVNLPASQGMTYKTEFEKEAVIIHHVVVLCLIILLFFAIIGVIVSLFSEAVRESLITKENGLFLFAFFSVVGAIILLKKLAVISNTIFLFSLGILLGVLIPLAIRKRQRNSQREDRP